MLDHGASHSSDLHSPQHGSYRGHVIPGVMFLLWSTWWTVSIYAKYLRAKKANKVFSSKSWYPWPRGRVTFLEPIFKVMLPTLGILIELRLGHKAWRRVYVEDGHFNAHGANNFQHAAMYAGFALSGLVDLLGIKVALPEGTEKLFLSLAFMNETILMSTHQKHHDLDVLVHAFLSAIMALSTLITLLEIWLEHSVCLALMRAFSVFFQGTWFIQVGHLLYFQQVSWDLHDPNQGGLAFAPVVFCLHVQLIGIGFLVAYLLVRWMYQEPHAPEGYHRTRDFTVSSLEEIDLVELHGDHCGCKVMVAKEYKD